MKWRSSSCVEPLIHLNATPISLAFLQLKYVGLCFIPGNVMYPPKTPPTPTTTVNNDVQLSFIMPCNGCFTSSAGHHGSTDAQLYNSDYHGHAEEDEYTYIS